MSDNGDWLAIHSTDLSNRVKRVFEVFEKDLREEFSRRDQERQALSDHISSLIIRASRADALQSENEHLQAQLAAALQTTNGPARLQSDQDPAVIESDDALRSSPPRSTSTVDTEPATVPYADYAELSRKYNLLRTECDTYRIAHESLLRKYREIKENLKEWREYIDHKFAKERASKGTGIATLALSKDGRDGLERSERPALTPSTVLEATRDESRAPQNDQRFSSPALPSLPPSPSGITRSLNGTSPGPVVSGIRSSQTTDDVPTPRIKHETIVVEPEAVDDDIPIVVSARSLKRKQWSIAPKPSFAIYEDPKAGDGTPNRPVRIKSEGASSPVAPSGTIQHLARTLTLDLDEVGQTIDTPRKRRRLEEMLRSQQKSLRSLVLESQRQDRSTSVPVDLANGSHWTSDNAAGQALNNRLHALSRSDSDSVIKLEDRATTEPVPTDASHYQTEDMRTPTERRDTRVLHPLSTNTRILPRTSDSRSRSARRRDGSKAAANLHLIAEDGDVQKTGNLDTPLGKSKRKTPISTIESDRRLQSLLENTTPAKQSLTTTTPITTRATRSTVRRRRHNSSLTPSTDPDTPRPEQEPLRSRPLQRLNLDDFKVNPAYNQGIDYAFVETARNRDARRCLPGCTRPECCGGAFRALVEAGAAPTVARRLWDPSQESTSGDNDSEEARLLKDHMGDAYDSAKIAAMPADEQRELVLQARTRLFADRHGRHRQAYERRKTPPGFWRTDMPTTQEEARDREEARRMEREKVEERWREAMREGGRWILRDE